MFDKLLKQAELYALKLSEWFNELDFEIIATFLFFICLALLLLVLIKGVIKTFKRQPIVGILIIPHVLADHDSDQQWGTIYVEPSVLELPYTAADNSQEYENSGFI